MRLERRCCFNRFCDHSQRFRSVSRQQTISCSSSQLFGKVNGQLSASLIRSFPPLLQGSPYMNPQQAQLQQQMMYMQQQQMGGMPGGYPGPMPGVPGAMPGVAPGAMPGVVPGGMAGMFPHPGAHASPEPSSSHMPVVSRPREC